MSLLSDYDQRTRWKFEPIRGAFSTAENLSNKVNPDGSFTYFPGSTVVFRPEKRCMKIIQLMQEALCSRLNDTGILAVSLPASTIHMTLHDLLSPENSISDLNKPEQYLRELQQSLDRAAEITEELRKKYAGRKIRMTADRIVSMVSKSLVLLLRSRSEEDYELLLEMYRPFDEIVSLAYSLTPHITLAYYKPGMLDGDRLGAAVDFAQIDPENAPVFEFEAEGLTAQYFSDMKNYFALPERICFCCDGGLNRSVMAAQILNHRAKERGLPVTGEARSAYPNTQGQAIPQQLFRTLEEHGIQTDRQFANARYLEDHEFSHFSSFAAITDGALARFSMMSIPEEIICNASLFFFGIPDPEYGEISYEQAFTEINDRIERYLNAFEKRMPLKKMPDTTN